VRHRNGALRVYWTDTSSCNLDRRFSGDIEDDERDGRLAAWLVREIRAGSADLVMGVFDQVDAAGHRYGFEDDGGYRDAIRRADVLVGGLLDAIGERVESGDETWLVVLTSDHGGHDVVFGLWGAHDDERIRDEAIPFVVATYGTDGLLQPLTSPVRHMDVHPTVLAFLGVAAGDVDGRVQGLGRGVPAKPLRETP